MEEASGLWSAVSVDLLGVPTLSYRIDERYDSHHAHDDEIPPLLARLPILWIELVILAIPVNYGRDWLLVLMAVCCRTLV